MPSSDRRLAYWDACVPLSYINGYGDRLSHIEGILQDREIQIITSVFSIVEVAFALKEQQQKKLDPEMEEKIAKLWQVGSPILLVEFYELLAIKARNLMRAAVEKGFSLKPADALHLATADHLKVTEFQTYDDLEKFSELTESHLKICVPIARQPVMAVSPSAKPPEEKPQVEAISETKDETPKAAAQAAAAVPGSGSGHPEGQAGAEKTEKEAARETMNDVIELFGNCEAEKCKRPERGITDKGDLVIIGTKTYHRGCEPTKEEQEARKRSSV